MIQTGQWSRALEFATENSKSVASRPRLAPYKTMVNKLNVMRLNLFK